MKRHSNLYEKIISIENLKLADKKARKGKHNYKELKKHIQNEEQNIQDLHQILKDKNFKTSEYTTFKIYEGKERIISKLPYFPDRLLQHAVLLVLEPIFVSTFTADTYSCIRGRGVHKASYNLRKALQNKEETKYCLKLDIKKFYPNVDNEILMTLLRRKFKDKDLLNLLENIIMSMKGLPIGSYTSQFFANFYLTYFDHWIKEELKVKYYFKYCDDIVILSDNKEELRFWFFQIKEYLCTLNLEIKSNYQIFPVEKRGIDWVGFKHYHTHTLIRKSIKKNYIRSKHKERWNSWLIHANTINLKNKYENNHN